MGFLSPPGPTGGHPNIAAFYGHQAAPNGDAYVLVESTSVDHLGAHALRAKLASYPGHDDGCGGGLSAVEVASIAGDVLNGLCHLHGCNIVHGSLSLESLRKGDDGKWKFFGFATARASTTTTTASESNALTATMTLPPSFRPPPEATFLAAARKAKGENVLSAPTASTPSGDVWSFGVLLHWLVFGEKIALKNEPTATWQPPRGEVDPAFASLSEMIQSCVAWQPASRPTVFALRAALDGGADEEEEEEVEVEEKVARVAATDYVFQPEMLLEKGDEAAATKEEEEANMPPQPPQPPQRPLPARDYVEKQRAEGRHGGGSDCRCRPRRSRIVVVVVVLPAVAFELSIHASASCEEGGGSGTRSSSATASASSSAATAQAHAQDRALDTCAPRPKRPRPRRRCQQLHTAARTGRRGGGG